MKITRRVIFLVLSMLALPAIAALEVTGDYNSPVLEKKHTKRTCEAAGGDWVMDSFDEHGGYCDFSGNDYRPIDLTDADNPPPICLIYPALCGNSKGGRMQIDLDQKVAFSCRPFPECEIECQPNCPDPEITPPDIRVTSSNEATFCRATGGKWHKYKGCVRDNFALT